MYKHIRSYFDFLLMLHFLRYSRNSSLLSLIYKRAGGNPHIFPRKRRQFFIMRVKLAAPSERVSLRLDDIRPSNIRVYRYSVTLFVYITASHYRAVCKHDITSLNCHQVYPRANFPVSRHLHPWTLCRLDNFILHDHLSVIRHSD